VAALTMMLPPWFWRRRLKQRGQQRAQRQQWQQRQQRQQRRQW
jgi:hypothetical protein